MRKILSRLLRWAANTLDKPATSQTAQASKPLALEPVGTHTLAELKANYRPKPPLTETQRKAEERRIVKRLKLKPVQIKKTTYDASRKRPVPAATRRKHPATLRGRISRVR